ncbi:hypothetical protein EI42_01915 [Thermosporothrix hazakensis]|jgi:hypothetical protein|uniref:Uncharacterized protein n=1 Tax=Thermosporothrix hazakensis TaxID=644383 RepID=A0A326UAC9_THEHA|nr:hypothetical protein EI42_01915 [Thermosporothrix hazakensis]
MKASMTVTRNTLLRSCGLCIGFLAGWVVTFLFTEHVQFSTLSTPVERLKLPYWRDASMQERDKEVLLNR